MKRVYTLSDIADKLERAFVIDESIPEEKRQFAKILIEELRGNIADVETHLDSLTQFVSKEEA